MQVHQFCFVFRQTLLLSLVYCADYFSWKRTDMISKYDVIINDVNNTCDNRFIIHFMNYINWWSTSSRTIYWKRFFNMTNIFFELYFISKVRPHGTVSSPLDPWWPYIWDMRRVLLFGKLLFLGIRGLNSLTFTFKLTQANYLKFATKCRADGTKKSSRQSFSPVKSTVSKEEERNYQWKREKNSCKQCPSRIGNPV